VAQQLIHWIRFPWFRCQITILGIPLQQPLAFEKAGHALSNGMGKLGEFVAGRRLDPAKPRGGPLTPST
jgi:hypothetical protein